MAPVVHAMQALKGVGLVVAATLVAEVGDFGRFANPRQLMAYLGVMPGERSSGGSIRPRGITKAGSSTARTLLFEAAWAYRLPAKVGRESWLRQRGMEQWLRDLSWRAQARLSARYRRLTARGKRSNVAITAVARELVGFIWAIATRVRIAPLVALTDGLKRLAALMSIGSGQGTGRGSGAILEEVLGPWRPPGRPRSE